MTKDKLIYLLNRYRFIAKALRNKKSVASFYVGNRKETIIIDESVKIVFSVIDDILKTESRLTVKIMNYWLKLGYSDVRIISETPLSRSAYYAIKRQIENKIYQCCIFRELVSYNELLSETIGVKQ